MTEKKRILIVEDLPTDAELNARETQRVLPKSEFLYVETRKDFLAALASFRPHLIISDFKLPQFDGLAALKLAQIHAPETPFIIVTGSINEDTAVECMTAGAWDYVIKEHIKRLGPAVINSLEQGRLRQERKQASETLRQSEEKYRELVENINDVLFMVDAAGIITYVSSPVSKLSGHLPQELVGQPFAEIIHPEDFPGLEQSFRDALENRLEPWEFRYRTKEGPFRWARTSSRPILSGERSVGIRGLFSDITDRKQAEKDLHETMNRLRRAMESVIDVIVMAVEARDRYTAGHQKRVGDLAAAIASEMGLPSQLVEGIHVAGTVHDLGKISIPAEILSMPRKLNESEFNLIKTHPQNGYDILKKVDFEWPVAQIVYQHHERLDGSGYPLGRRGDDILLEARIVAIADTVEAMASHRPYRPALGMEEALKEIILKRAIHFDPLAVDACLRLFREKGYRLPSA